jgi:Flp pilus assembly protein TadB
MTTDLNPFEVIAGPVRNDLTMTRIAKDLMGNVRVETLNRLTNSWDPDQFEAFVDKTEINKESDEYADRLVGKYKNTNLMQVGIYIFILLFLFVQVLRFFVAFLPMSVDLVVFGFVVVVLAGIRFTENRHNKRWFDAMQTKRQLLIDTAVRKLHAKYGDPFKE